MADDLLADWFVHPLTVERFAGAGATGDVYADPEALVGFVDDEVRIVRGANGEDVVSSAGVFLPAATADVPVKTRVTLGGPFAGRPVTTVIVAKRHDAGGQPTPNHLELRLA